jgi:hypothetical protein
MKGSLRQRGAASWELRVDAGTNPDTGKRRHRTATVVGNRADAERALARLVAEVESDKTIGSASTVSELLEAWFAIASTSWAPTTVRETRSILRRCVHPHLGARQVADVTPAMIDALYAMLRVHGSQRGGPLAAGTIARVHVVVRAAFSQAQRWAVAGVAMVRRASRCDAGVVLSWVGAGRGGGGGGADEDEAAAQRRDLGEHPSCVAGGRR